MDSCVTHRRFKAPVAWVAVKSWTAVTRCPSSVTAARWTSFREGASMVLSVPTATLRAVGKNAPGCWAPGAAPGGTQQQPRGLVIEGDKDIEALDDRGVDGQATDTSHVDDVPVEGGQPGRPQDVAERRPAARGPDRVP